jgi:hypothetical protein
MQEIYAEPKGAEGSDGSMSWMVRGSSPGGGKTFISSLKVNISCGPCSLLFDRYCSPFVGREKSGS